MPTLRSYPQATSMQTTDALLIDRNGIGTMWILFSDFLNALQSDLPYDVAMNYGGSPPSSSIILTFIASRDFTLAAGLAGSVAQFTTGPSVSGITLGVYHNGVSIGSIAFPNTSGSASNGVFSGSGSTTAIAAGDIIEIETGTTTQGATNLAVTLYGTRTA